MIKPLLEISPREGESIQAGTHRLTPYARRVRLIPPLIPRGWVWSRPDYVIVEDDTGTVGKLIVRDTTREAILRIIGFSMLGLAFAWLLTRKRES